MTHAGVGHTNVERTVRWYFHLKHSNVREVLGDDKTTSKLGRGEPKWHLWGFVQLELCMAPVAHTYCTPDHKVTQVPVSWQDTETKQVSETQA